MKYELKNDDILYFLHIAKTGGTSFKKILDSQFDESVIVKPESWFGLLLENNWDFSKSRLIRGHYGVGIHHILPKVPIQITMLREPISRTISWYHFLMDAVKDSKHPRLTKLFDGNESLFDLLLDPIFKRWFKNVQVRYLSLDFNLISLIQYFIGKGNNTRFDLSSYNSNYGSKITENISELGISFSKFSNQFQGKILDDFLNWPSIEGIDLEISEEKLLKVAKKNLTEMPFFGICEQFDESVSMLCNTFNWKPVKKIPKENIGNYQKSDILPEYVLKKIKQETKLDHELYKFGRDLFNKRLSEEA